MTCVSPTCRAEIPEDSLFCDQCGTRQAVQATAKSTDSPVRAGATFQPDVSVWPDAPARPDAASAFSNRPVVPMNSGVLNVSLPDGSRLSLPPGSILGRSEGPLSIMWADAALVSGRHAKIELDAGQWTFTDLYSSNGSSLNGHYIRPGKALAIQPGDKLLLGNKSIVVL